ncbi:unnamed protein product [Adineta ricciae]|uniref:Uncharacterized protein n=1 Tax=Adineta ricciae TaxID=249248 RepID=A0A815HLY9_ADIRI|nr:unnamed protein product [Adineta ricciae]
MFKKFRHRAETKHMKMNDSALRDIIPSDDVSFTEEIRKPRLLRLFKIFLIIFVLGLVAVGIVLSALILTYSGKSFLSFVLQSSGLKIFSLANTTISQENLTSTSSDDNWQKITISPASTLSTLLLRTGEDVRHRSMKFDRISSTIANEQSSSFTTQTEISSQQSTSSPSITTNARVYITTSSENRVDSSTSIQSTSQIRDHETSTIEQLPATTNILTQPSRKFFRDYYRKLNEDIIIDDLLFS